MLEAFLITFRESLEAAVIVGILLAVLRTLGQQQQQRWLWLGVVAGVVASGLFAVAFAQLAGGFSGSTEKVYEGLLMLGGAALITQMVFWLRRHGSTLKTELSTQISSALQRKNALLLTLIAFIAVVREGVETVIFLQAIATAGDNALSFSGALLGVIAALATAGLLFWTTHKVAPLRFLRWTSVVLLFVAAGLIAHGIVEFQGADWLPTWWKPVFDLSSVLSEKTGIGSFLKALFGYDANPSALALVGYFSFLVVSLTAYFRKK